MSYIPNNNDTITATGSHIRKRKRETASTNMVNIHDEVCEGVAVVCPNQPFFSPLIQIDNKGNSKNTNRQHDDNNSVKKQIVYDDIDVHAHQEKKVVNTTVAVEIGVQVSLDKDILKSVTEELICPICNKLFIDPSSIECGHTFWYKQPLHIHVDIYILTRMHLYIVYIASLTEKQNV